MEYPLRISFANGFAAHRLLVEDGRGGVVWCVERRLGGPVEVFAGERREEAVFRFDRVEVTGFKAAFALRDASGRTLGTVAREGRQSEVRERYDLLDADACPAYRIEVADARKLGVEAVLLRLGPLAARVGARVDPGYSVETADPGPPSSGGEAVVRMQKEAAGWGTAYVVDRVADLDPDAEALVVLSLVLMLLRQRVRV